LIVSSHSPYDVHGQAEIQGALGWDRRADGLGIWDFLPYYYPPWLAILCVPLLGLGFEAARVGWLFINFLLLTASGLLLRDAIPGVPRTVPPLVVPAFAFSLYAALMGQTSPLILFLVVLSWRLLADGHDWTAGVALAWLTVKPQVTAVLLLALAVRIVRERRWKVVAGFGATLAALCAFSSLAVPGWLPQMVNATRVTPLPTAYFPWVGTTWLALLRSIGLGGPWLALAYAAVAMPIVLAVVRLAAGTSCSLLELIAIGLVSAFFVAHYAQCYDFALLTLPLLLLIGRLEERRATAFLLFILIGPYLHATYIKSIRLWWLPATADHLVATFWVPLLLGILLVLTARVPRPTPTVTAGSSVDPS
jgi:hypothetical protein